MKIRKVDDKPMVIHTKRKPRLHTGKKAVTGKKAENTSAAVKGRKPHIGIRDKYTESGRSVKVSSSRGICGTAYGAIFSNLTSGPEQLPTSKLANRTDKMFLLVIFL